MRLREWDWSERLTARGFFAEEVLGIDSVTAGVLRALHQGIVLTAATHIHERLLVGIFTSDVRTADGWQLVVDVFPGANPP